MLHVAGLCRLTTGHGTTSLHACRSVPCLHGTKVITRRQRNHIRFPGDTPSVKSSSVACIRDQRMCPVAMSLNRTAGIGPVLLPPAMCISMCQFGTAAIHGHGPHVTVLYGHESHGKTVPMPSLSQPTCTLAGVLAVSATSRYLLGTLGFFDREHHVRVFNTSPTNAGTSWLDRTTQFSVLVAIGCHGISACTGLTSDAAPASRSWIVCTLGSVTFSPSFSLVLSPTCVMTS